MSSKLPLDMLIDLAKNQTDDAARRLGALQSAHLSARQKLDLLLQYRQDYHDQLDALMRGGLPSSQWRNYRNFLGTLDGAIEQQRAIATQTETRLDRGRTDWQQEKRRLNSFDTLAERVRMQELMVQAKREQRDSDERSARKFFDRASHPTL
ncbi:flagellar export protein FliJ [Variovorax sp. PAMC26660]|uniref:flagellar export protein FliJ n=1 Tax=Variovorax sp. PAMC26660 TaxID=2762322 RepID=UPI00164D45F9|nr:flagellar export protein FliJ [Variovorax sp. PAMC26660]QNK68897.1 flagella biosynthesis chaperone FliJ [Variovorax sp. PAMC26660]